MAQNGLKISQKMVELSHCVLAQLPVLFIWLFEFLMIITNETYPIAINISV